MAVSISFLNVVHPPFKKLMAPPEDGYMIHFRTVVTLLAISISFPILAQRISTNLLLQHIEQWI